MPTIFTCGGPGKSKTFTYEGDRESGVIIKYAYSPVEVSPLFLKAAIGHFKGKEVKGGFSMTDPPPGGFGYWVQNQSKTLNKTPLTPRHGSHIAAILREMGYLQCRTEGNTVIVTFNS